MLLTAAYDRHELTCLPLPQAWAAYYAAQQQQQQQQQWNYYAAQQQQPAAGYTGMTAGYAGKFFAAEAMQLRTAACLRSRSHILLTPCPLESPSLFVPVRKGVLCPGSLSARAFTQDPVLRTLATTPTRTPPKLPPCHPTHSPLPAHPTAPCPPPDPRQATRLPQRSRPKLPVLMRPPRRPRPEQQEPRGLLRRREATTRCPPRPH